MIKVHEIYSEKEIKKKYFTLVDQYIKINAAIDLMRVGVDVYSNQYPTDHNMAYGTIAALKYIIEILEQKMVEVRRFREKAGYDPLPADYPSATKQIFRDHYGVTYPEDEDDDDTV